ncbi:MAG TPA: hypothetical protein RMH99_03615 [Sandaracinaceae bacterium LLY-WYZ-13_1]|nr:hypothetical protein [Sandaracinaceae bacterium LLY-WYZ-13_1]
MGFFSNLKNAVTGGAATVQIEAGQAQRGQPVPVRVQATAKSDSEINGVYVLVRAIEQAEVRDTDFDDGEIEREIVRGQRVSFEHRVDLGGPQELKEGESYTWEGEIPLPPDVGPTFRGHMICHEWEIQGGLDAFGNDPDSGWVNLEVW